MHINNNIIVFTHNDNDGIAGYILSIIINNRYRNTLFNKVISVNHNETENMIESINGNNLIIFIDLAPDNDFVNYCISNNIDIEIYDHHEGFYNQYNNNTEYYSKVIKKYIYNQNMSGSEIFYYNYFIDKIGPSSFLEDYLKLVTVYDLWLKQNEKWEKALDLQRCFVGLMDRENKDNVNQKFINFQILKYRQNHKKFIFLILEKRVIKNVKLIEKVTLKRARDNSEIRRDNSGNLYIFIRITSKISFIASKLLEENLKVKYIIIRDEFLNNGKYSIRSRESDDNFNCITLAEKWNGSGHKNASGFVLNEIDDIKFINNEINLI